MKIILPIKNDSHYLGFYPKEATVIPVWYGCSDETIEKAYYNFPFLVYSDDLIISTSNRVKAINTGLKFIDYTNCVIARDNSIPPSFEVLTNGFKNTELSLTCQVYLNEAIEETLKALNPSVPCLIFKNSWLYISKNVINSVGVFDEWLRHGCELEDYVFRSVLKGFNLDPAPITIQSFHSPVDNNYETFAKQMLHLKYSLPIGIDSLHALQIIKDKHSWLDQMYIGGTDAQVPA